MSAFPSERPSDAPARTPAAEHLEKLRAFYDARPANLNGLARGYRALLAHYFNLLIPPSASVLEVGCGDGSLLGLLNGRRKVGVDLSPRQIAAARARMPDAEFHVAAGEDLDLPNGPFDVIIVSDTLNLAADVQLFLERLHRVATADTRLLLNFYSSLWRPALAVADLLGARPAQPGVSWLASSDVANLLSLSDWSLVRAEHRLLCPVPCAGVDRLINRWIAPLPGINRLCLTVFNVARPSPCRHRTDPPTAPSLSVIIPARNEAGNIAAAVSRTAFAEAATTELVFVEGHSTDDTWEVIQAVCAAHPDRLIRCLRQPGTGKADAVRAGIAASSGEIIAILDADLTTPPEELPKFVSLITSGRCELANGVRLVYPMAGKAMPFLNLCANKAFGLLFGWLIGQPVKDTLCGTKVLRRRDYDRIAAQRTYFGDFDPFGDFDLLFGAAKLNMKIADVPVHYRERTYGHTNIRRWRHGWILIRMMFFAARKLKFV